MVNHALRERAGRVGGVLPFAAMEALADARQTEALVTRFTDWLSGHVERGGVDRWALVGLRRRGDVIARRAGGVAGIAKVGALDITMYRDDLVGTAAVPNVGVTDVPFALDELDVVLVDDVLMTGRSIRAALDALVDLGRPRRVWLAVLVDRGPAYREYPIAADFAALTETRPGRVHVRLTPTDEADAVTLRPAENPAAEARA